MRDLGVALSDRRVVKVLKLVAASAVLCGRTKAAVSDFWVFRYVWDREEQIAPLRVAGRRGDRTRTPAEPTPIRWPRCLAGSTAKRSRASSMRSRSRCRTTDRLGLAAVARLRERLAELSDQAAWVNEDAPRTHLIGRVRELFKRLG